MNWKPIDTAPKDGTPIMVATACKNALFKRAIVAWRNDNWIIGRTSDTGREVPLHCQPTHWQEIDDLPKAA